MKRLSFKLPAALGIVVFFTACATMGPPLPPSLDLPKPPTDVRAARKGGRVTLTWTIPTMTTDRQRARSFSATRICRAINSAADTCGTGVGEVAVSAPAANNATKKKPTASYTDTLPPELQSDDPTSFATYTVEVRNADGRSAGLSNQVRVPLISTLPPPKDLAARVVKEGIVLSWSNSTPQSTPNPAIHYTHRIYRRQEGIQQSILIDEVPAGQEQVLTFTDSNIEWQKTYQYRVVPVTIVALKAEERVEGDDSPEVKVFADDVFPPAVPSGLQAVFSGPGQKPFIDLIWAPVPDIDLDGYNVYRREGASQAVKLNSASIKTPAYRDVDVAAGKHYFYSVSAVDVRGNESARSEEAEENVP